MVSFDLSRTLWHKYSFIEQVKSMQRIYEVIGKHSYGWRCRANNMPRSRAIETGMARASGVMVVAGDVGYVVAAVWGDIVGGGGREPWGNWSR
jgi:hypothetical protein